MAGSMFDNGLETKVNGVTKTITHNTTIAAVASADGAAAAGANPTKAEYDVVVALANESKTQLNTVIATLKTAGIIL